MPLQSGNFLVLSSLRAILIQIISAMSANQSIICRALIPLGILIAAPAVAAVSPYAHYRMGDGVPSTNGGNNLP